MRSVWRATIATPEYKRLVFVDEMGTHTSPAPSYGYPPRGRRTFFGIPRNGGTNTTLLSSMSLEGMGPSTAIEGSTTKEAFEACTEHFLAPALKSGQIVVMDNLTSHKGERVRRLIEGRGRTLPYLPPYSPDPNPIEEAFSKIKRLLRAIGARTKEAPVEAKGKVLAMVGVRDTKGFFTHCGYRGMEQQLWKTL